MKKNLICLALMGLSIISKSQVTSPSWDWPFGNQYVSFTHPSVAGSSGKYALLQHNAGNTYLNSFTDIYFRINNVDKMKLTNNGAFGIGTTTPGGMLHVKSYYGNSDLILESNNGNKWDIASTTGGSFSLYQVSTGLNRLVVHPSGSVGIGTNLGTNPNSYLLAVNGTIGAKAVKVEVSSTTWSDYVFDKNYKLKTIKELEFFVKTYKHLPDVPSAIEVEKDGIDIATMDATLLAKIEELTLYLIQQNKKIEILEKELAALKVK